MEVYFLALLVILMALALASGFPVAFSLPGSAILTILIAAGAGMAIEGSPGAYLAHGSPEQWLTAGVTNFRGVYWVAERDTLIAIPLFIFMGIMLQRSRIAEDLLVTMAQLFGPIPGGLGISVVFVGALLAATTGILGATVVAMGLISLPAMMRNGYSASLSSGTIAASGTLGQIIPPSIVLIILADQLASATDQAGTQRKELYKSTTGEFSMPSEFGVTSTSAGEMFMGALLPGLVLVGLYMLYILVSALIRPRIAPPVPKEGGFDLRFAGQVLLILVPPLTLIFVVLGSIILGVATVNQAGAIGAVGATVMAGFRLRKGHWDAALPALLAIGSIIALAWLTSTYTINVKNIATERQAEGVTFAAIATGVFLFSVLWSLVRTFRIEDTLNQVMLDTAKTTSLVFVILLGAAMLTAAFRAFGGEHLVQDYLTSLPGGFWSQFITVMVVIFLLGFFLDFIEIAVVVVPIVAPILLMEPGANVTAVWLGVMIGLNIQTSFLTPPFGFALFYLRGVADKAVKTVEMYKGVVPYILLQLVALGIVGYNPPLVNYLPTYISLTGPTAPPPVNPQLLACVEGYLVERIESEEEDLRAAIERARALPFDMLAEEPRENVTEALDAAGSVFARMSEVAEAQAAIAEAAPDYRPVHDRVRNLQSNMRRIDRELEDARDELGALRYAETPEPDRRAALEATISRLEDQRAQLESQIPAEWDSLHETFAKLVSTERRAKLQFRRALDESVEPIEEEVARLSATDAFAALEDDLAAIEVPAGADPDALGEKLKALQSAARSAEAGDALNDALRDARRPLRDTEPDLAVVREALAKARSAYQAELTRRRAAVEEVLPGLRRYLDAVDPTFGLRQEQEIPESVAEEIVGCQARHRDISLYF